MPKQKSENNELALRELLIATNYEKLVDILLSLYHSNHDVGKQLNIIFSGLENDPKKIAIIIKRKSHPLKRSSKFVDYYKSDSLAVTADRLNDLRLWIVNDLNAKSPKVAFEMMLDFLDLHKNTLKRVDDSNSTVSGVFLPLAEPIHPLNNQDIRPTA